jgi:hypothetical protein
MVTVKTCGVPGVMSTTNVPLTVDPSEAVVLAVRVMVASVLPAGMDTVAVLVSAPVETRAVGSEEDHANVEPLGRAIAAPLSSS